MRGLEVPAMDTAARDGMTADAAEGTLIYNTDITNIELKNATGSIIAPNRTVGPVKVITATSNIFVGGPSDELPNDFDIPTTAYGHEAISLNITPSSASNFIVIEFSTFVILDFAPAYIVTSLFRDPLTNPNAITYNLMHAAVNQRPKVARLTYTDSPNTTSPVTYSVRIADMANGTVSIGSVFYTAATFSSQQQVITMTATEYPGV